MKKGMIASAVLGMVRTNCYFLINRETDEALIIDPADDAAAVRDWFLNNQKKPAAILLTHGHFDHILAAEELRKRFDIKIYAGDGEQELLENASWNLSASWSNQVVLHADEFVKDGEILSLAGFQIRVIATPGHTAGGVSYYLPEEQILFSGDTLFAGSYGRVDFPTSSMSQMVHSVRDRLLVLPEDTVVYPGHGEATTIGQEKRYNPLAEYEE